MRGVKVGYAIALKQKDGEKIGGSAGQA